MKKHWKLAVLFVIALAASALSWWMGASSHPDDDGCGSRPSPPEDPGR